jgi:hypothetical protein
VQILNEKFGSGFWVPIKAWLDDVYDGGGASEFYNAAKPYYHISSMKAGVGIADSLLYALGAFDDCNPIDRQYWIERFPWRDKFPDNTVEYSFQRDLVSGPWNACSNCKSVMTPRRCQELHLKMIYGTASLTLSFARNRYFQEAR